MKKWLLSNQAILLGILEYLDTPISLGVAIRLRHKEWDSIASMRCDPQHYPEGVFSALRFRADLQAVDLLRKAPLPTSVDRRSAALRAWEDAETACYVTNEFLARLSYSSSLTGDEKALASFLSKCKKRMGRWLGRLPTELSGGFGPGTCVEYEGSNPTVVDKIWLTPTTTPSCASLFEWHYSRTLWGQERWNYRLGAPGTSRGNRLTTVPKDGKTDRPISIEPVGNLWLQKGIGSYLKHRITDIGLPSYRPDSRELFPGYVVKGQDAQAKHRELLFRCRSDGFATIDLSSASDTLSTELVRWLLPSDWFDLMDDCRSKLTFVPSEGGGKWRHIEKFSSMGNGFTFELESLVFCVLLSVAFGLTPGQDLWVFGDDILLPKRAFRSACNLLSMVGFTPNLNKSFGSGPFYESCGGNVHSDVEVTPLRLKGPIEDPPDLYAFHNACFSRGFPRHVLRRIRDLIPKRLQFPGPTRAGDVVLHGLPFREVSSNGISYVRSLRMSPVTLPLDRWGPELAVVSLLLGCTPAVTRRRGAVKYSSRFTSIS